jgi:small ligand-binding sensory domain FIST
MGVRIGSGLSTASDARAGAAEAARDALAGLEGAPVTLAVVFASGVHLAAPEATLEGAYEALEPESLIGCGAGGVLGHGREIEEGTAVAVWAASLPDGAVTSFHAEALDDGDDEAAVAGVPELVGASAVLLLPDPYSFPTDALLADLHERAPAVPVLGGVSSARTFDGASALFHDGRVLESGAVGVCLSGVELLACVSQGATPVGPELTVTAAEGHVIQELAGRPALERLREVFEELPERERALVASGPLVGLVIAGGKPDYGQGDFLVRGVLGADPDSGAVAVGASVRPGQVLRLHARDAESADRDLRSALALRRTALGEAAAAGALMFTCNGRGSGMFGEPDHDARVLASELPGAAAAGFFAAGEIGPVGGESFLHGFTATVAVFA